MRQQLVRAATNWAHGIQSFLAKGGCLFRYDDCFVLRSLCLVLHAPMMCREWSPMGEKDLPRKVGAVEALFTIYEFTNL